MSIKSQFPRKASIHVAAQAKKNNTGRMPFESRILPLCHKKQARSEPIDVVATESPPSSTLPPALGPTF